MRKSNTGEVISDLREENQESFKYSGLLKEREGASLDQVSQLGF